jgi:fatty-acyl-CoA synthase
VVTIANASSALPPAHARRLLEIMPNARLNLSYAASEAVPASIGQTFDPARPMATGRPTRRSEVRIVDDHGDAQPTGELGEIWLRSPAPKRYYFNNPQLNATVHADRWTRTGDLGRIGADGLLYFFDRRNVAVRVGDKLVSTVEVEAALYEHEGVQEAAVFGVPRADDQAVVAVVVVDDPEVLAGLPDLLAGQLAPEQVPERIIEVREMPRSANGKVLKHVLREQLKAEWAA